MQHHKKDETMTAPIECLGKPATFNIRHVLDSDGEVVPKGSIVSICAWHEGSKEVSQHLSELGYQVSQGACNI